MEISELQKNSWEMVCEYFDKELTQPYLHTSSRSEAYKDLYSSIDEKTGVNQPDIPITHNLLYFKESEIETVKGLPSRINFYLGGILIPKAIEESETEEDLLIQATQENTRDFLRAHSSFFDFCVYSPSLELFETSLCRGITLKILEGMEHEKIIERFWKADKIYEEYLPANVYFTGKTGMEESLARFREDLEEKDPIEAPLSFLDIFGDKLKNKMENFYSRIEATDISVKRWDIDDNWEELEL